MDPILPVAAAAISSAPAGAAAAAAGSSGFLEALGQALERTDAAQLDAERVAKAYQMGAEGVTLEASMVAMQEANVSLQFLVQVRNRLVSAYHDIMNMPV
jgi:flagellar hook-basal body complex protein FliE